MCSLSLFGICVVGWVSACARHASLNRSFMLSYYYVTRITCNDDEKGYLRKKSDLGLPLCAHTHYSYFLSFSIIQQNSSTHKPEIARMCLFFPRKLITGNFMCGIKWKSIVVFFGILIYLLNLLQPFRNVARHMFLSVIAIMHWWLINESSFENSSLERVSRDAYWNGFCIHHLQNRKDFASYDQSLVVE